MILALLFLLGTVHYQLQMVVEVPKSAPDQKIRLWIPHPPDTSSQKILQTSVEAPYPWQIKKGRKFGNRFIFIEGAGKPEPWSATLRFDLERKVDEGGQHPWSKKDYLGPTPWIPFSEEIQRIAVEQTKGLQTPFQKIRALYDYIYETMTYNKKGEGWGRGDPIWACANKRGNCTDFHSLFIALAHSQNIPARFEIGLAVPAGKNHGAINGYHCWAQAFDPQRGWIPLDASESKKLGKKDFYFSRLGHDRVLLSAGRGIILNPPQKGEALNFFFYPYAEVAGRPLEGLGTQIIFKRIDVRKRGEMSRR